MGASEDLVAVDIEGGIATLCLARVDRANALDGPMFDAIGAALDDIAGHPDTRVVIVRGEGRHFCAGGDLDHPVFSEDDPDLRRRLIEQAYTVTDRLLDLTVPVVCAVQGRCAGAALALVLASDVRVAAESAVFSFDFVRLGLSPDMGAGWLLANTVGTGRALDFALTGELMGSQRALDWGLVTRVVSESGLVGAATDLARQLAAHPPGGLASIRRLVRAFPRMDRAAGFAAETAEMARLAASADARERLEDFRRRARGAAG